VGYPAPRVMKISLVLETSKDFLREAKRLADLDSFFFRAHLVKILEVKELVDPSVDYFAILEGFLDEFPLSKNVITTLLQIDYHLSILDTELVISLINTDNRVAKIRVGLNDKLVKERVISDDASLEDTINFLQTKVFH
jgi:hypothetical protein